MINNNNNPWLNMENSSQRRVDSDMSHNVFWITDLKANYGFCIQAKNSTPFTENEINLKGISIIKRTREDVVELFLILNDKVNWQIFHILCNDLIEVAKRFDTDEKMISATETRLKRWQQLLKQDRNRDFTVERQMGLFSELICLKDVISPKVGVSQAIVSWVGPEYDKQDFLLDDLVIEVKSYKTSKGELINISSKDQLYTEKDMFYLITYALTISENGSSVRDVIDDIKELLMSEESYTKMEMFENKLMDYGYIPEIIKEPLQKFILDKQKIFHISDSFPRILPQEVKHQIVSVNYTINLSECKEFEIKPEKLWKKENFND